MSLNKDALDTLDTLLDMTGNAFILLFMSSMICLIVGAPVVFVLLVLGYDVKDLLHLPY